MDTGNDASSTKVRAAANVEEGKNMAEMDMEDDRSGEEAVAAEAAKKMAER